METEKAISYLLWGVVILVLIYAFVLIFINLFKEESILSLCSDNGYDKRLTTTYNIEEGYIKCCKKVYNSSHEGNIICDIIKIKEKR